MFEDRARQVEELLVDRDLTLSEAVEAGLLTKAEAAEWRIWDDETRG